MTWFEWCVIRHWLYREARNNNGKNLAWHEKIQLWFCSWVLVWRGVKRAEKSFPEATKVEQRNWAVREFVISILFDEVGEEPW